MNLLITGAWQGAKEHFEEIEKLGHKVVFLQQEKDELPIEEEWVEGVICNGLFLYHPIERFVNLRYIQLTSAGFDRIDLNYVKAKAITMKNARGVYSIPLAEFVLARVLERYKRLETFREQQTEKKWNKLRDLQELFGKRILIIGCGSVGTECAKRFKAFDCEVVGIDVIPRADDRYSYMVGLEELNDELTDADVIVLTLPLTNETRGLIDRKRLKLIKKSGILINIARGPVIDQAALEEWDGNAILDVFEEEPLIQSSSLWGKENFYITPHNSFIGENNSNRLEKVILENLIAVS